MFTCVYLPWCNGFFFLLTLNLYVRIYGGCFVFDKFDVKWFCVRIYHGERNVCVRIKKKLWRLFCFIVQMMKSIQCISFDIIYCAVRVLEPNTHTYTRACARVSATKSTFFLLFFMCTCIISFLSEEEKEMTFITKLLSDCAQFYSRISPAIPLSFDLLF